ncbi:MAG: hypothetical protein FJW63_09105 [Actinobacteria bacterium]|nr:hypothetical protein [Actinomycetota bacterium]
MPLTKKGEKIMSAMQSQYGAKKGKQVFYASANKGNITGVHKGKKVHMPGMSEHTEVQCSQGMRKKTMSMAEMGM